MCVCVLLLGKVHQVTGNSEEEVKKKQFLSRVESGYKEKEYNV